MLNIPIKHVGGNEGRQRYADVIIDHSYNWAKTHWRTLETAYRTSPYFEFYEDDLIPLFLEPFEKLLDFNLNTIEAVANCIGIQMPFEKTEIYDGSPKKYRDGRGLVEAKKPWEFLQQKYSQVFEERHGFVKNTSILDLLFNLGPDTVQYLKNQPIDFL